MPNSPTPNMGLIVPTVGGDSGLWGNELNSNLATLDALALFPFQNFVANGTLAYNTTCPIVISKWTTGAGGITVTLPDPTIWTGKLFVCVKVDSGLGTGTLNPHSTETISGQSNWLLTNQYQYVGTVTDGANWIVVCNN